MHLAHRGSPPSSGRIRRPVRDRGALGDRESNVHATFELPAEPAVAATAADLTARESQCCTFWLFTLTMAGGRVTLDVRVPPGKDAVLDALVVRAQAVSDGATS